MRTAANWLMKMYERQGRDERPEVSRDLDVEALSAVRRRAPGGDRSVVLRPVPRSTQMSILWPGVEHGETVVDVRIGRIDVAWAHVRAPAAQFSEPIRVCATMLSGMDARDASPTTRARDDACGACARVLFEPALAEDAVQEAWLAALRATSPVRGRAAG